MSRAAVALPLLLALVLLGGCVDDSTQSTPTTEAETATPAEPTATPSTTTTPAFTTSTTTARYDCPYDLHVDVATDRQISQADRIVAYETLSTPRRQEFERALGNGSLELGDDLPDAWASPRIVEYRGERYRAVASTC